MEEFKPFSEVVDPDIRSKVCGCGSLKGHHQQIEKFVLHSGVPESIRSYFATAQNVLLYTWFSFDLYPVAELRVLIALEMALQEKIGEKGLSEIRRRDKEKGRSTGMQSYVRHAIRQGWIKNEDFSSWHRAPLYQAKTEQSNKAIKLMSERGVSEINLDEIELEIPEVNNFDFLNTLTNWTNKARNGHAHGNGYLYPPEVWRNFEMVTEFVNVIFHTQES